MADNSKKTLSKDEKKRIRKRIEEINKIYNEPSTQNAIPYTDMTRDGICLVPKKYFGSSEKLNFYSVTLKFGDINYQLASDDDQANIFQAYCEMLNYFDDNMWLQLTFENRQGDNDEIIKKIESPEQKNISNKISREYSDIIISKITEGNNGKELVKFLTYGVFAKNIKDARLKLSAFSAEIISMFKKAKVIATQLTGEERLAVLYRALNPHRINHFLFDWDYMQKIGSNTKDYIAPSSMRFNKNNFELGDCHGSVMSVDLIASELKDRILYDFLDEDQLFCINIHIKPFDILAGQKVIERTLLNVKTMKADKLQKQANQGLYGGDIPGGLQEKIDKLEELLKGLKSKDEKLFQITLTIRSYAKTKKEMKAQCDLLRRICQKNSNILIPCDYQQEDGLCASLPLGVTKILNILPLHTTSLAAFMPFTSRELFHIDSPRAVYYGINPLTRKIILACKTYLRNPNSLILGTPGAGKSFLVKLEIVAVFFRTGDDIFINDPEGEYSDLVSALGGQVIKLSATSKNFLNPMDIVFDKELIAEEDPVPDKINFLLSLMELIVGGGGLSAPERSLIDRAAKKIYENFLYNSPSLEKMPILEDLWKELERYEAPAERLTTSLEMYVYGSQKYFNNKSNVLCYKGRGWKSPKNKAVIPFVA